MTRPRAIARPPIAPLHVAPLRSALGGLLALAVGIGIGRFVYTPILPPMMAALGLSKFAAGLIASANFAGYLTGALLAARGRLPGGRRAWLLIGLGGSAVTTGAMGLTAALPAFLALRFAGGIASAVVLILVSAIVLEFLAEAGRSDLSALLFAGVGSGVTASALLVSVLQAAGVAWPALWLASGGLSAFGALAAGWLVPAASGSPPIATAVAAAPADLCLAEAPSIDRSPPTGTPPTGACSA